MTNLSIYLSIYVSISHSLSISIFISLSLSLSIPTPLSLVSELKSLIFKTLFLYYFSLSLYPTIYIYLSLYPPPPLSGLRIDLFNFQNIIFDQICQVCLA